MNAVEDRFFPLVCGTKGSLFLIELTFLMACKRVQSSYS